MPDDEALEEIGDLLQEFYEGSWTLESARAELDRVRQDAQGTLEMVRRNVPIDPWKGRQLRSDADILGTRWSEEIRAQFEGDINETRHSAYDAADQAEFKSYRDIIDRCKTEPLINAQQVLRVIRDLSDAEDTLTRQDRLTPEITAELRGAKERAGWYRARKKLDEAEVAEAGGNTRKVAKLRAEAAVLLKQDWHQVFPNSEPPPLKS